MNRPKKSLYRIDLNWKGEMHTFHTHAFTEDQAIVYSCVKMQKKLNYDFPPGLIYAHITEPKKDRVLVTKLV
jgi:hypothetical protein